MKKILWITNQAVGPILNIKSLSYNSGTWMDAALESFVLNRDFELGIAYLSTDSSVNSISVEGIQYFSIPSYSGIYDENDERNIKNWNYILSTYKPDLLMIWGTENAIGLCAQKCAPQLPSVILIQGYISSIYKYYYGGLSDRELSACYSFRNLICRDGLKEKRDSYRRRMLQEQEAIERSKNIIVDNKWIEYLISGHINNVNFYNVRLNIKDVFFERQWVPNNSKILFCTSPGGYPLKGFHQLIKALAIVKEYTPEILLKVPGMNDPFAKSKKDLLKEDGYIKFLKHLIERFDLRKNIQFLGRLDSVQIADALTSCNAFIVPSAIENHSISLREAMTIGCPVIASYAGGMPEIIRQGQNGFVYRFEEYEMLAVLINLVVNNRELSETIGKNARLDMMHYFGEKSMGDSLAEIYKGILD